MGMILREDKGGVLFDRVREGAPGATLPAADPLPSVWSLMRSSFLQNTVSSNKKAAPIKIRECGRETNGVQLFSLPYAGITQVRF